MRKPGGISDYAIELERENQRTGRKPKPEKVSKYIPGALQESLVSKKIHECIQLGMEWKEAESELLRWNAGQASPMRISRLKEAVYHAYHNQEQPNSGRNFG